MKEAEANSEVTNFIRSRKQKQKIPRVRKQKRIRKNDTLRRAGSGGIKYSTASTSLILKFDFVIISLKKYNLAKSRNFRSPKSKLRGAEVKPPAFADF